MPLDEFKKRWPENSPGKYYVSDQCLDCDLCRTTAPANFRRNAEGGFSYVFKQPESPAEEALVRESMDGCCVETIHSDGDAFDWIDVPADIPFYLTAECAALQMQLKEPEAQQPNIFVVLWRRIFRGDRST